MVEIKVPLADYFRILKAHARWWSERSPFDASIDMIFVGVNRK